MSESRSPRDYGQPESPTEEYDPHYYEQHQQQQQQQNDQDDLGPPASPDGSPDYSHEYQDAPASPAPEGPQSPEQTGPQSPDMYDYSQIEQQPESPENILQSPTQDDDLHSQVQQHDQISEANEPKSPDNGPHDYPDDEQEGPKSPVQEYEDDEGPKSPVEDDEEGPKSPELVGEDDSDNDDNEKPAEVEQLMTNIFGEDSDEEDEQQLEEGDNEARVVGYEDEEEGVGYEEEEKEWDFDRIMEEKKRERSKKRKRRKDGSIDLCSNADGQIRHVVELMKNAAGEDRDANNQRRPAIQKTKMLEVVRNILLRADYLEALIENDMMSAISEWLAPLPDKSLPALEIRTTLLKILASFPNLEPGVLKQSGLGKAVMLIFKHPKETKDNKIIASKLIRNWSQPIFQISSDYSSITKEERETFDYEHLPEAKRRKLEEQRNRSREAGSSRSTQAQKEEAVLQPGDPGYISRARVPKLSTSAYIIRPKNKVEGNFHGSTKNRQNGRFDKAQREFKERTRSSKSERAIGVSIEGRRMD